MVPDDGRPPASPLSSASCVPHSGSGLVGRWGDVLLVVAEADEAVVAQLVKHCEAVAQADGDGRMLSRRLAGFLTTFDDEPPAFAAAAPIATGLAVFIQGSAEVVVGDEFTISGAASLAWVDRLVPWPVDTLTMTVGSSSRSAHGPYNLQRGSVPGAGLTMSHASASDSSVVPSRSDSDELDGDRAQEAPKASAEGSQERSQGPPELPLDRWPGRGDEPPSFESVVIDARAPGVDDEAPRPPLPVISKDSGDRPVSRGPVVRGVYCKNGHFNDARVLFCAVCGINMVQQTPVVTDGPRPPLGVLVLDDGSAFQLDADYVLGRDPTHDDDVRSGRIRGITLSDADKSVSRAHARIELRQWDVMLIDNSSANGTYIAAEGENSWTPLSPGVPHTLTSGSRIRLGSRTLAFNSYRGE
jgi:FHA domain